MYVGTCGIMIFNLGIQQRSKFKSWMWLFCISHRLNNFEKGMHPTILSLVMGK